MYTPKTILVISVVSLSKTAPTKLSYSNHLVLELRLCLDWLRLWWRLITLMTFPCIMMNTQETGMIGSGISI